MTTGEFITRSPDETFELGRQIGASLAAHATFLLTGDLGAGKTLFTKGLAAGLGIAPEDVTSPSFTLINIHDGRLRLYHIDLYRLDEGASGGLGLEEIFEEAGAVVVIEWADRLGYAPEAATRIHIEYLSDSERKITITNADRHNRRSAQSL
ncbi:MAG TPA: tRNA (adenosine(37)-N6)-threonylcarbamoyltransferase complex ATPase subunit type 1 TsaE [Blastocatellia bacterium]|nr:tRNA (adenosine(37)-N6)-threonylcarbamoyltransferase complex ATPase subunit type 1 TsaE [Blastocatellia bacterium]